MGSDTIAASKANRRLVGELSAKIISPTEKASQSSKLVRKARLLSYREKRRAAEEERHRRVQPGIRLPPSRDSQC